MEGTGDLSATRAHRLALETYAYRWFEEVWNRKEVETIHELMSDDNESYGLSSDKSGKLGKAEFLTLHAQMIAAFPDMRVDLQQTLVDGDRTASRYIIYGTHLGDIDGLKATQKRFRIAGISIIRWRNGKAIQSWNNFDQLGLLQQIGFIKQS